MAIEGTRGHGDMGTRACARGHAGKLTRGQGAYFGGSVDQKIIFGSQVTAIGCQVRVVRFGYGCGPEPVPAPEYLNLAPDGRDPGPQNVILVSGFPLRVLHSVGRYDRRWDCTAGREGHRWRHEHFYRPSSVPALESRGCRGTRRPHPGAVVVIPVRHPLSDRLYRPTLRLWSALPG